MEENIRVGSQVIIRGRYHQDYVETVKRETKLYWFVGEMERRFRKSDLYEPGDKFGRSRMSLATKEKMNELSRINLAINLKMEIEKINFKNFSIEKLNMIKDAINYPEVSE